MKKQTIALVLAVALVIGCSMGGTMAWLTSKTPGVQNIFTTSDIKIELTESGTDIDGSTDGEQHDYKMIPGWTIAKDPLVTVKAGSEDCWVFIKVEETGGNITVGEGQSAKTCKFDDFIAYQIDTANWTPLDDVEGVYYTKYENRDDVDIDIKILAGGEYTDPMGVGDSDDDFTISWGPNEVGVKPSVTKEIMNALTAENYPTLTFTAYATQYWENNDTPFAVEDAWQKVKPVETTTP